MQRPITIVGAPTSIGIRPYDDGTPRGLDRAPAALRRQGVVERLGAKDAGDLVAPPYRDLVRPAGRPRNEADVEAYSRALAVRVESAIAEGSFVLVLGGDCSVVLGALLGARRAARGPVGLAYVDGHADFATPAESRTGSVASMCLGLAVGRGDGPLSRLAGPAPLVEGGDVALIGRRDAHEPWYGHAALAASGVLDLPDPAMREKGLVETGRLAAERVGREELAGFWIHVDADVLDPAVMPAVDSPEPGGPGVEELAELLAPLVSHPGALGMELTIYDPALDPGELCAGRLVGLLAAVLAGRAEAGRAAAD
jgi:arginase